MPRPTPEHEHTLVTQIEADRHDPEAWEAPEPSPAHDRKLGVHLSVRLSGDLAEALEAEASTRGIGITQLARELIAEGLRHDRHRILIEVELDESGDVRATRLPQAS